MVDIFDAKQGRDHHPRRLPILDVEIMRIAALHVAHDAGDRVRRTGLKDPMAVIMKEAPAVNPHAVERGVLAHVGERLLKVFRVAVDPLALVAALGDGVKLLGTEVTRKSHAVTNARWVPSQGGAWLH